MNIANKQGATAMHKSAVYGQVACIKKLCEFSADVNLADAEGNAAAPRIEGGLRRA